MTFSRTCVECDQKIQGEALFCPWCGHEVASEGPTPVAAAPRPSNGLDRSALIAFGAAAALIVGSFLPWIKLVAPFVGTITKSGTEGSDGWFTVAVGAVVIVLALRPASHAIGVGLLVSSAAAAVLVAYEFSDISQRMADARDASELVSMNYGAGLYLCTAGIVAGFVAGTTLLLRTPTSD